MPTIGLLASIAALSTSFWGLPAQIVKNFKNKSSEGLSPSLIISSTISYGLWSAYGWTKEPMDWFIIASQTPGSVLFLVLLFQLYFYRDRK